jgi:hypothetical protein
MPPLLRRRFAVAAKIESTPGEAESLAAPDLIPNVFDAEINPDISVADRVGPGAGIGELTGFPEGHAGTCSFMVELTAENSPAWAAKLLPAAGLGETAGVYSLDSRPPGGSSDSETITIGVYRDGVLKRLRGAVAERVTFRLTSGGRAMAEFEFRGIWVTPSNVALLNPTNLTPIRVASGDVTIGSFEPKFQEMTIEIANTVALREDVNDESGYCSGVISSRRITGTINAESTLSGTHGASVWDPYADMLARTTRALAVGVGGYEFDAPALQVIGPTEGDRNNIQIDDVEFLLASVDAAGDDELEITVPTA